jgi:hypothetical protein
VPLCEYTQVNGGRKAWSTDATLALKGYRREARPLCLVWQ